MPDVVEAAEETPETGWHLVVDPACDGWRLDRFLAHRLARVSRSRAARLRVRDEDVPGAPSLKKSAPVRKGQRLFAERPLPDAGVQLPEPTVLYEDDELLVLDKPAGWAAHPTASRHVATIKYWLSGRRGDASRLEPIHRLDVETSGVMAVARTLAAARFYQTALEERALEKTYLAVVEGVPATEHFASAQPLGFDAASEVRLKMGAGTLPASTRFRRLWSDGKRAVVEARPVTGRQHQIRVHLAMAGLPIVGDKLYGPDERLFLASLRRGLTAEEQALLGAPRHALHARRLALPRRGGGVQTFTAPWPADLEALATGFTPDAG